MIRFEFWGCWCQFVLWKTILENILTVRQVWQGTWSEHMTVGGVLSLAWRVILAAKGAICMYVMERWSTIQSWSWFCELLSFHLSLFTCSWHAWDVHWCGFPMTFQIQSDMTSLHRFALKLNGMHCYASVSGNASSSSQSIWHLYEQHVARPTYKMCMIVVIITIDVITLTSQRSSCLYSFVFIYTFYMSSGSSASNLA